MLWGWNAGAGIPEPLRKGLSHVDGCQGIATKPGRLVSVLLLRPQLGSAEKETAVMANALQISSMEGEKCQHDQKYA